MDLNDFDQLLDNFSYHAYFYQLGIFDCLIICSQHTLSCLISQGSWRFIWNGSLGLGLASSHQPHFGLQVLQRWRWVWSLIYAARGHYLLANFGGNQISIFGCHFQFLQPIFCMYFSWFFEGTAALQASKYVMSFSRSKKLSYFHRGVFLKVISRKIIQRYFSGHKMNMLFLGIFV